MDAFIQSLFDKSIIFAVLLLLIGFVLLVKGADFFVDGSSQIAKKLKIPSIIIGMTVVAMGTSLPELAVSVNASLSNSNSLAISNAIGSNIFNLMAVIGLSAVMTPVAVQSYVLKRDFPMSVFATVVLLILGFISMSIGLIDGLVLLFIFVCFISAMVLAALKSRKEKLTLSDENESEEKELSAFKCILYIILGAAAIILGGDLVVDSAVCLAYSFGMSETLVGLTIVSIGTSLPELVTSVVAARKNEVDIALGNALGSNVFNILMILGVAGAISPMTVILNNLLDIAILIVLSLIVWAIAAKKRELKRSDGILMLVLYLAYMAYIIIRDM